MNNYVSWLANLVISYEWWSTWTAVYAKGLSSQDELSEAAK